MAEAIGVTAIAVVLVVLLLPALTFRWTGDWWCMPNIAPAAVRARAARELAEDRRREQAEEVRAA